MEAWEPRRETVPLHAWLHPWLPMLQARLQDLHPGIRFKLATALQQWHPADQSAMALLSPWHHVRPPPPQPPCRLLALCHLRAVTYPSYGPAVPLAPCARRPHNGGLQPPPKY